MGDDVLFDETGTLSMGEPTVIAVESFGAVEMDPVLAIAAAAEGDSEHPLVKSIVRAAEDTQLIVANVVDTELGIDRVFGQMGPGQKFLKVETMQKAARLPWSATVPTTPPRRPNSASRSAPAGTSPSSQLGTFSPVHIPEACSSIRLSRRSCQKMRPCLRWTPGPNIIAVPLAAPALDQVEFVLPMSVGENLKSTLSVLVGALHARLLRPPPALNQPAVLQR